MRPLLDSYGVNIVALSKDTPEQAQFQRQRDNLSFTLLTDPQLKVIKQFGLLHRGGITFETFFVAGIPLGYPAGFKDMAIPTTLIIDEAGIIRWIDQADDYRMRGDAVRIEKALEDVFGERSII